MAQETITLRLVAQDLMSGNVTKAIGGLDKLARKGGIVGSVIQGVGQSFGQMLNPVGMVTNAIGGVVDALGDAQTAYRADQMSQAKLRTALEANIDAWDGNTDAIEDVIAARMDLGYSDDEQRESLALLVAQVENVTDALAIQRTAMDLARLKEISLTDASTLLAKAYLGATTGLQKMGIKLAKGVDGMEAIAAVQRRAAGQAKAWAETSAGAAEVFAVKVGEMQEKVGAFVDTASRQFLGFLSGVVDVLDGPEGANKQMADLAAEIYATGQAVRSINQTSAIDQMAKDLARVSEELYQLEHTTSRDTFLAVGALGEATIKASGATIDRLFQVAQAVYDTTKSYDTFNDKVYEVIQTNNQWNVLSGIAVGAIGEIGGAADQSGASVQRFAKVAPTLMTHAVVDMKSAIKEGKAGIVAEMRDLAWQSKHPFAEKRYADWLKEQEEKALRRMNKAVKAGRPGIAAQHRQLAADIRAEYQGLPGYMWRISRKVMGALSIIPGFSGLGSLADLYGMPGGGGGKKGGKKGGKGGRQGPETMRLSNGTASRAEPMRAAGGGSINVTINAGIGTDPAELGRHVTKALRAYKQGGGGPAIAAVVG